MGANSNLACRECPAGTYNPLTGSATELACLPCAAGTWSSVPRATAVDRCNRCLPGTYGVETKATSNTSCIPCPPGTYSDTLGAAGTDACQFCPPGTYSLATAANERSACLTCPLGAICPGRDPPYAGPGAWYSADAPTVFVRCTPPEACRGGNLRGPENSSSHGDSQGLCMTGYEGERCSECAPQHYRFGGMCRSCPRNTALFGVLCVAALVAALLGAHAVLKLNINLAPLTIAVDYFQVLSNVGRFDVHWPAGPSSMLTMFSLADFNVEVAAPECFVGVNFTRDWLVVASLPCLCAALLVSYHIMWRCCMGRHATASSVRRHWDTRIGEILLLLQVMYLTIAGKALQLFNCTELVDGSVVLNAAPYIRCWERGSEHVGLVVMGSVAALVYVAGIPVLFWRVLRWARQQEQVWMAVAPQQLRVASMTVLAASSTSLTEEQASAWLGVRRSIRVAGNLRQRFRSEKGHWLLVVMARKLALVCAFVFFSSLPQTQIAVVAIVLLVALELHHRHLPYVDRATQQQRQRASITLRSGDEDSMVKPKQVEIATNPMWDSGHLKMQALRAGEQQTESVVDADLAVESSRIAAAQRLRRARTLTRQSAQGSIRAPGLLSRIAAAAEDANVMEWVALVSALVVLLSALVYHAARQELVMGTEAHVLNLRLFLTDLLCVSLLLVTCGYMTFMAMAPLARAFINVVRRWRSKQSQASRRAPKGSRARVTRCVTLTTNHDASAAR